MGHREITLQINDWHRYAGHTTQSVIRTVFFLLMIGDCQFSTSLLSLKAGLVHFQTKEYLKDGFFSSHDWRLPIFLFFAIIESRPCPFSNERVFEGGKIHIPSIRYTGGRNIHFVPKLRLTYAPLFRSLWGRLLWCPAVQAGQFLRWRTAAQDASSLEKKRNKVKIPKF